MKLFEFHIEKVHDIEGAITLLVKYLLTTYALDVKRKKLFGGASRRYSQVRQTVIKSSRLKDSQHVLVYTCVSTIRV